MAEPTPDRRVPAANWRFLLVAFATACLWAALVAWVPLLPSNLYMPLLDLGKITHYTWPSAVQYVAIIGGLYVLYAVGYVLVRRGNVATARPIFVAGGVFAIELIGAYPATAVDVFGYIAHGRVLAFHQQNPFFTPPDAYPADAIIKFLAFPGEPSQYGPVWVLIGDVLATLSRGDLLTEIVAYKLLAAVGHLGSGVLILSIATALGATPCRANASAYLFVCNPLLLWEMVANAHNDGLMMVGGLAGLYLMTRQRNVLVLPALALGALVKLPLAIVAPLFTLALWHRSKAAAIEGFWLAVLLAALVYRPFWEGAATLTALRRTELFTASLGSVVRLGLAPELGGDTATQIARWVSLGAFGIVVVVLLGRSLRDGPLEATALRAYVTMLAAALLATTWFQAWYIVWPFAFAAPLPNPRHHLEVALLSLGGFAQYFVFIYLWVIGVFPPFETLALQVSAYLGIIGPPVLGVLVWRYIRASTHIRETVGAD